MQRFFSLGFLLTLLCFPSAAPALAGTAATVSPQGQVRVHLGESVVPLYGPWKFRVGDSPVDSATGQKLWSEPGFDDSKWENVDLTPKQGVADPIWGISQYTTGWTKKGHPGYWGYAWYRIRINVESHSGVPLAIAGPSDVDDIYQVFDNGRYLGAFGDFSSATPIGYTSQPLMFPVQASSSPEGSTRVLAFRVWMEPYTLTTADDVGGFHDAPQFGAADSIRAQQQVQWDRIHRAESAQIMEGIAFTLLAMIAFGLIFFDRTDRVYLWIGFVLMAEACAGYLAAVSSWTLLIPYFGVELSRYILPSAVIFPGWIMVLRSWFGLRRPRWLPGALLGLAILIGLATWVGDGDFLSIVPIRYSGPAQVASIVLRLVAAALMLDTVIRGIREQGIDGWLLLPAAILAAISEFGAELMYLHIVPFWFPFGVQISIRNVADFLLVATVGLLLLRRLVTSIRQQRQMALDVKQAQEVQKVILPESHTAVPGLEVETEYRPSREVGGDFLQVIAHKTNGSLLIVAGDVAGKGLQAGMLVALLVGAIRSTAEQSDQPEFMLSALNRRLCGRNSAFATCLALRIDADGTATLANAGHLPPYLNHEPLDLEGSLPLGIVEEPEFSFARFWLKHGDRLTLLSDGVAEAKNADGGLFGFERVQDLLRSVGSAAEIAAAAQRYGQEDDISVISVLRTEVLAGAEV